MGEPITNNSCGGGGFSQALLDAILVAEQAGVLFVASAGASSANLDEAPTYPASYDAPNIVTVAATDADDQLASFSNYGEKTVDLAAPGVEIPTTQLGSTYFIMSGTSAATAHVSGALALVLSRFPGSSASSAATHLLDHTEKVPSLTGLVRTGRLDAYGPLGETPTDVPERSAATVSGNREPRLWWKSSSHEEVHLVLYLPFADRVQLTVFDVRGRRIRQLYAGPKPAGFQEIALDARDDHAGRAASGVYLVNLHGGSAPPRPASSSDADWADPSSASVHRDSDVPVAAEHDEIEPRVPIEIAQIQIDDVAIADHVDWPCEVAIAAVAQENDTR